MISANPLMQEITDLQKESIAELQALKPVDELSLGDKLLREFHEGRVGMAADIMSLLIKHHKQALVAAKQYQRQKAIADYM